MKTTIIPFSQKLTLMTEPPSGSASFACARWRISSGGSCRAYAIRVYEKTFQAHRDTLIDFKAFDEALQGSKFAKTLQAALEPLYQEQKKRFASLKQCIAKGRSPSIRRSWKICRPRRCPTGPSISPASCRPCWLAASTTPTRKIAARNEWLRLLGISRSNVRAALLQRAGIQRHAYTVKEEVNSQREAKGSGRVNMAPRSSLPRWTAALRYMTPPWISPKTARSSSSLRPVMKSSRMKNRSSRRRRNPHLPPAGENSPARAHNMQKPGNWTKASWDPQFIYWELVKACCLLHGYQVMDAVGIVDPETGEVWTNPTLDEVISLITGELPAVEPEPG